MQLAAVEIGVVIEEADNGGSIIELFEERGEFTPESARPGDYEFTHEAGG